MFGGDRIPDTESERPAASAPHSDPRRERGRTPPSRTGRGRGHADTRASSPPSHLSGSHAAQGRLAHHLGTFPQTLLGRTPRLSRGPQASPGGRASPGHCGLGPLGTPGGRRRLDGFRGAFPSPPRATAGTLARSQPNSGISGQDGQDTHARLGEGAVLNPKEPAREVFPHQQEKGEHLVSPILRHIESTGFDSHHRPPARVFLPQTLPELPPSPGLVASAQMQQGALGMAPHSRAVRSLRGVCGSPPCLQGERRGSFRGVRPWKS